MVDPITTRPIGNDRSVASFGTLAPARSLVAAPVTEQPAPAVASSLGSLVADYAATAPVDSDRVQRIRHAIANNTYPITPETVADRLLALKLNWNANEPS